MHTEICQFTEDTAQCTLPRIEGSLYCEDHQPRGNPEYNLPERRLYELSQAQVQERLTALSNNGDQLQVLHELIAVIRVLLEKRISTGLTDSADIEEASDSIPTLHIALERLTNTTSRIEHDLNQFVSKQSTLHAARGLIRIVEEELRAYEGHEEAVSDISRRIFSVILSTGNTNHALKLKVPKHIGSRKAGTLLELSNPDDQLRFATLARHERLKALNEDVALGLVLLEKRLNLIRTVPDLIAAVPTLCRQVKTIEKLIKSSHEVSQVLGELLGPDAQAVIRRAVPKIISEHIRYVHDFQDLVDRISDRITASQAVPRIEEHH